ncbi:hypothetical protein QTP88_027040 [Uroleucon formosanum]
MTKKTQPIQVYCRLKPSLMKNEKLIKYEIKKKNDQDILCFNFKKYEQFQFQNVFNENTTQSSIFEHIAVPILDKFLHGINSTIFTYGQTGSGKTHTIVGSKDDKGIIPRSFQYIFTKNAAFESPEENEKISVSYFQVYNEEIYDLIPLKNSGPNKNMQSTKRVKFVVNVNGEIEFKNLNTVRVKNVNEALELFKSGNKKRIILSTTMNDRSSRSHCICKITYLNTNSENETILNLVDLAGSERISKNSDINKKTLTESRHINVSLLHLHRVINTLANGVSQKHVPYRNSIITLLLKGSLGFKCATALISTIVLSARSIAESVSTLRYAKDVSGVKSIIEEPKRSVRKRSLKLSIREKDIGHDIKKLQTDYLNIYDGMIPPRVMESGDRTSDNLKTTKDVLISANMALSVGDDKLSKSCQTMDVVATTESKSFTVIDDEKLIECVRNYPVLYTLKDKNYIDNTIKENVWKQISDSLGKTVNDCKMRWSTIRDFRKKNMKKIKLDTGSATPTKSKYTDDVLSFLNNGEDKRRTKSNITFNDNLNHSEVIAANESFDQTAETESETMIETDTLMFEQQQEKELRDILPEIFRKPHEKQTKRGTIDKTLEEIKKGREERLATLKEGKPGECYDSIQNFFKSVVFTVTTLPPELVVEAKKRVFNIIKELQLRALKTKDNIFSSLEPIASTSAMSSKIPVPTLYLKENSSSSRQNI